MCLLLHPRYPPSYLCQVLFEAAACQHSCPYHERARYPSAHPLGGCYSDLGFTQCFPQSLSGEVRFFKIIFHITAHRVFKFNYFQKCIYYALFFSSDIFISLCIILGVPVSRVAIVYVTVSSRKGREMRGWEQQKQEKIETRPKGEKLRGLRWTHMRRRGGSDRPAKCWGSDAGSDKRTHGDRGGREMGRRRGCWIGCRNLRR